jgi:hypothetical protein
MKFGGFYPAGRRGYVQLFTDGGYLEVIEVDRFEGKERVRRGSGLRGEFRARVLPFA